MKLTDVKGNKIEIDFKEIKAHVGKIRYYNRYRLVDGTYMNVMEDLHQIRALNEAFQNEPETVVEDDESSD